MSMMYKELLKINNRDKADSLAILRNAYHAKDVKKLMDELLKLDQENNYWDADDLINFFQGLR